MISLCMIVKNEEKFLKNCLDGAAPYVDDIVVADTGSADATKAIAQSCGAAVFDFAWADDFSAARNFAASRAKYDWIFVLDADEEVVSFDKAFVDEFIKGPPRVGSIVRNERQTGDMVFSSRISRLYNRRGFSFTGSIHEQITPVKDCGCDVLPCELPIVTDHFGYSPDVMEKKGKLERNRQMLEKELLRTPNDPYYLYQMGKTYFASEGGAGVAAEYFEKALSQNPSPAYEYVYSLVECFGYALINSGQYEKSMAILKYSDVYGHNPNFRFLLAHIYQNNGRFSDALEHFESCIGKSGTGVGSFLSYYNIGVILEAAGLYDNAAAYYRQCGDYKPAIARLASCGVLPL